MKILVLSDSHGYLNNLKKVLKLYDVKIKYIIHLGDYENDVAEIKPFFKQFEFINISGNCDFETFSPSEKCFPLCGKNFFITHGHMYRVKANLSTLSYAAEEKNADICLFGHTHIPVLTTINDVLYLNPGSISIPRAGKFPTYGILNISENNDVSAEIFEIHSENHISIMQFKA